MICKDPIDAQRRREEEKRERDKELELQKERDKLRKKKKKTLKKLKKINKLKKNRKHTVLPEDQDLEAQLDEEEEEEDEREEERKEEKGVRNRTGTGSASQPSSPMKSKSQIGQARRGSASTPTSPSKNTQQASQQQMTMPGKVQAQSQSPFPAAPTAAVAGQPSAPSKSSSAPASAGKYGVPIVSNDLSQDMEDIKRKNLSLRIPFDTKISYSWRLLFCSVTSLLVFLTALYRAVTQADYVLVEYVQPLGLYSSTITLSSTAVSFLAFACDFKVL